MMLLATCFILLVLSHTSYTNPNKTKMGWLNGIPSTEDPGLLAVDTASPEDITTTEKPLLKQDICSTHGSDAGCSYMDDPPRSCCRCILAILTQTYSCECAVHH